MKLKQLVSVSERQSESGKPHDGHDLSGPTAVPLLLDDMLVAPDWLSPQREDWIFFGPSQQKDPI